MLSLPARGRTVCLCLLAAIICQGVFSTVSASTSAARQAEYDGPYSYEQQHEEHYQDSSSSNDYGGEIHSICLQPFDIQEGENGTLIEKFRCCEPAEGTYEVSCPGNSTTTHQRDWKRDGSGMFADTVLTPETAAVCTTVFGEPSCPPFVGDTGCVGVVMECTVNPKAAKCGCPFRDGIKVQATGYSLDFEFLTCNAPDLKRSELVRKALGVQVDPVSPKATVALQEKATRKSPYYSAPQAPTAGTVYIGAGARFQGAIDFVTTSYGAEERKGTFEYLGVNSVTGPAPTPLPKGVPLVSTPQLKIRLLEQKHY